MVKIAVILDLISIKFFFAYSYSHFYIANLFKVYTIIEKSFKFSLRWKSIKRYLFLDSCRFPEWQDCHEMWSKERKKQQRENAEVNRGMLSAGSKIPDVSEPKVLGANFNAKKAPSTTNNTTNSNINPSKPFPGTAVSSGVVKLKDHLPPPPPLPSLLGGASLGMDVGKTSDYNKIYQQQKPPNECRPNFTNRGIMNPTGLIPPKKVEKLSDYSSDLKPVTASENTLSADVKLNHFISKPVNSGNTGAGGQPHVKWPT